MDILERFIAKSDSDRANRLVIDEVTELGLVALEVLTAICLVQTRKEGLSLVPGEQVAKHGRNAEITIEFVEESLVFGFSALWLLLRLLLLPQRLNIPAVDGE